MERPFFVIKECMDMKHTTEQGCGKDRNAKGFENTGTHVSEIEIGNTQFVIISECSSSATETLEQKLLRIMRRHACGTG